MADKKRRKLRNNEYYDMQSVLDKLYADSKTGKSFNGLLEIISQPENIKLAYRNIRKNSGSKTAGADKKTISDLNQWQETDLIKHVQRKLDYYLPNKVRRVEIPKDNGKTRPLGIPTIMDRLIQQCILQVLEPICEAKFHERNNGFRPNRSTETAIAQAERLIQQSNLHYVVDIDIKGFFDNVNHSKLLKQMWTLGIRDKKLLSIISVMLKAEVAGIGFPTKGTPQGGVISPLLSNIVLNELDWWIASQWEEIPTKHNYIHQKNKAGTPIKSHKYRALRKTSLKECYIVRYADDFKLFCRGYNSALKLFEATKLWLKERLELDISTEKSKIVNLKRGSSEFLGFTLRVRKKGKKKNGQAKYIVKANIKDSSLYKIRTHAKYLIGRIQRTGNEKMQYKLIQLYNSYIIGVHNYYCIATMVNIDFHKIAFDVKKSLYNRLKDKLSRKGVITNPYIKEKYGKSKEVRFIGEIPIVPIAYVQHRVPMDKKLKVNQYTSEGRAEIHKNLGNINFEIMDKLMRNTRGTDTIEYTDNRISLYVAQKGKCSITGKILEYEEIHCHHKILCKHGGGDEYSNLVIVSNDVHKLIHATNNTIIEKYLSLIQPNEKKLEKVNKLRKLAKLVEL